MGKAVRRGIKRVCELCGIEVKRVQRWKDYGWARTHDIRTVLDIGANIGQFASQIGHVLPEAMVYSFEPLVGCYRQLMERMETRSRFQGFNCALGDTDGTATIYHNDFSPSSSLLSMGELHQQAFPYTRNAQPEKIAIRRLDSVAANLEIKDKLLVKIDVQGFEDKVLLGGVKTIRRAHILIVETTFQPLYRGQPLFGAIYDSLRALGFVFHGCENLLRNPNDGMILQSDSVFMRADGCDAC